MKPKAADTTHERASLILIRRAARKADPAAGEDLITAIEAVILQELRHHRNVQAVRHLAQPDGDPGGTNPLYRPHP